MYSFWKQNNLLIPYEEKINRDKGHQSIGSQYTFNFILSLITLESSKHLHAKDNYF